MRIRFAFFLALLFALGMGGRSLQAESKDLLKLFPLEADVFVEKAGLSRLDLPASVILECRPDLSDLRLFDSQKKEVPFLIQSVSKLEERPSYTKRLPLKISNVKREEVRVAARPSQYIENYEVEIPSTAPATGLRTLVFQTPKGDFVRRILIESVDSSGQKRILKEGASIFRFSETSTELLKIPLASFPEKRLIVSLEGEGGYLEPALFLEISEQGTSPEPRPLEVPLQEISKEQTGDRTVIEFMRPRGLVPDRLRLATSSPFFHRRVTVKDAGLPSEARVLGESTVFRMQGEVDALRAQNPSAAEYLEIPLKPARGDRLRVEIQNKDSPPLENIGFKASLDQPVLIFTLPLPAKNAEGKIPPAGELAFGGGRAHRPLYDLSAFSREEGLFQKAGLARLGEIGSNPLYDPTSPLQFAMRPGVMLDPRGYSYRRVLDVMPSSDGLTRFLLKAEDLALLRPDGADLRVVDSEGRQWPYLMEREGETEALKLTIDAPPSEKGRSRYRIHLPVSKTVLEGVTLETQSPFFDRSYRLKAHPGKTDEYTLAQGRLRRAAGETNPLTLSFEPVSVQELELVVEDGDDAPLAFQKASAAVKVPTVYMTAPEGRYFLLLGNPKETPPQYELASARDVILSVQPASPEIGPLEPNPLFSKKPNLASGEGKQQVILWAVLGAAVLGLVILSLKMARPKSS